MKKQTMICSKLTQPVKHIVGIKQPFFLKVKCFVSLLIIFISVSAVKLKAQSVGGTTTGANTYCSTTNSGVVSVTGYVGNILNWQSTTDGGNTWNSNLNTTPNQTYFNLNQSTCYRAVVKNGNSPPDTSTITCINVYGASAGGTLSGGGNFCDSSGVGTLTLVGYSGHITHWLSSVNNGISWTTITDTNATYNYSNHTQSIIYEAVVQTDSACGADSSTQAIFNISSATAAGTISAPDTVCVTSNNGTIHLTGYSGSIQNWQSSIDAGLSWQVVSNTTDSLHYVNINQDIWYRVIVQSGGCGTDTTAIAKIYVGAAAVPGNINGGGSFCGGLATGTLTLSGYTGTITNWISSTNNGQTWSTITNTNTTNNYSNLTQTTYYAVLVQTNSCAADTSLPEIVTVTPQTVAGTIASSGAVCSQINDDTLILTGNVGNVLNWLSSTNNGVTWTTVANASSTLTYSALTQTTQYAAVIQSGNCAIDTTTPVTITVIPMPTVNAGNDTTILQGTSVLVNAIGTGTPVWAPSTGLSTTSSFITTASPITTTQYIIIVSDSICVSADTILITVLQSAFTGKIANLITPNGDGQNDNWYIEGITGYPDNEVIVYNIHGNEVYRSKPYTNNWQGTYNGKDLPDGTYYYVLLIDSMNAKIRGSVDILRSK